MKTFFIIVMVVMLNGCAIIPRGITFSGEEVKIKVVDVRSVSNDPVCGCLPGTSYCHSQVAIITIVQDEKGRSDKWCGYFGHEGYEFTGIYFRGITNQLHMK